MTNLKEIKLSTGVKAFILNEMTIGQAEDIAEIEDAWGKGAGELKRSMLYLQAKVIIGVDHFETAEGQPCWDWPDLQYPLSASSPEIKVRRQTLKRNMRTADAASIAAQVHQRLFVGAQLEGNLEAQSNSGTETGTGLTSSDG